MRNTLILKNQELPTGFEWELKSVGTSKGITTKVPPLNDFDMVTFKQQKGALWLAELHRDGVISFGYLQIKKIEK
jgi:hypothetical protein